MRALLGPGLPHHRHSMNVRQPLSGRIFLLGIIAVAFYIGWTYFR